MEFAEEFEKGVSLSRNLAADENELLGEDVLSFTSSGPAANALPAEQEIADEDREGEFPESSQPPCPMYEELLEHTTVTEEQTKTSGDPLQLKMGLFLVSEVSAPPVPPTPVSAADRLIGLLQDGRSLERYVEEFVELAYVTNWPDACLNALFL
ncbi:hypothetical protein DPX16_0123 [Anabarilius grahami]|uniref:Uncharacterized protein n=1 Tax=Anabarilius grahami TaxID=495550 RepID=A0A3N0Z918_ANAGA|nr:hypothetical protein DPX16_0123 [Anabarilius grahami]